MWDRIAAAVKWLGDLLGGGGTTQVGKGNQAFTSSASGPGSPSISAGGHVYYNSPTPPAPDPSVAVFAELEELMSDLLAKMQKDLVTSPLTRDIVVEPRGRNVQGSPSCFWYSEADIPRIMEKVGILADRRLLDRQDTEYAFRMTQELVDYLKKSQ
jgi:hypothetical protein